MRCRSCNKQIRTSIRKCPTYGVVQRPTHADEKTTHGDDSELKVSGIYLFLFGFFYLYYKGWFKAALVHALLCFCLMGTFWIAIPFYAKKFVDFFEGL